MNALIGRDDAFGGIDFNSDKINLETQSYGDAIKFSDSAMLKQLEDAQGFRPFIINIQPLEEVQLMSSLNE